MCPLLIFAVVGVSSAEGEEILFQGSSTPEISVAKDPVTLWLAKVAEATRLRLAELTGSAVEQLGHLWFSPEGPPSADNIVDWVNVTPGQCVILAAQVVWTHQVQVALEAVEASKSSSKQLNRLTSAPFSPLRFPFCCHVFPLLCQGTDEDLSMGVVVWWGSIKTLLHFCFFGSVSPLFLSVQNSESSVFSFWTTQRIVSR